jgi:hypothetical protein
VRRIRGLDTRVTRKKLNALTLEVLVNSVNQKLGINATFHMEPRRKDEEHKVQADAV